MTLRTSPNIRSRLYDVENISKSINLTTTKSSLIRGNIQKKVFHYNDDYSHLVGWSSDFHISTVKDIKDIYSFKI